MYSHLRTMSTNQTQPKLEPRGPKHQWVAVQDGQNATRENETTAPLLKTDLDAERRALQALLSAWMPDLGLKLEVPLDSSRPQGSYDNSKGSSNVRRVKGTMEEVEALYPGLEPDAERRELQAFISAWIPDLDLKMEEPENCRRCPISPEDSAESDISPNTSPTEIVRMCNNNKKVD